MVELDNNGDGSLSGHSPPTDPERIDHRGKGTMIANAADEAIIALGATVTYEQVRTRLLDRGLPLSEQCFHRRKSRLYPNPTSREREEAVAATRVEIATPVFPNVPPPVTGMAGSNGKPSPSSPDVLADFLRFASAVELVGGAQRARQLLDVYEQLGVILTGGKR